VTVPRGHASRQTFACFLILDRKTKRLKNLIPTPRSSLLMIIVIVIVSVSVIVVVIVSAIAPDSGHICEDD